MAFEFKETEIRGLFVVYPHYYADERGSNMKTFHKDTFEQYGLRTDFGETMITTNLHKNVIRGFHFQRPPYTQTKLYYCLSGKWMNYSIDLRKGSPSYGKVIQFEMNTEERKLLYIPDGIANAHLILEENTRVLYQLTSKYMPEYDAGVRWDSVGADFGSVDPIITEKDAKLPKFNEFDSPFIYGEST
ncbi:MAG: dTDP-4-dehydrorhamnose 3,5-epimerase family protein [Lachnospiraceae bacterium]|nr:dTDP-4-dehydrorhamnose 3,5-epimerase family protein [Lachnospiraceae bacterium]